MKKTTMEYRMMQERQRLKIPDAKLSSGSLAGKFPVILDGGKTTIFITDRCKESETRERYQLRKDNKLNFLTNRPKV
jgi:hypothetical protein